MVGWMHYLGRGTLRDQRKGVKIIRDNKSDRFPFGEGECLRGGGDETMAALTASDWPAPRKFFELCELGSNQDWLCTHLMSVCLVNGFGTTQDQTAAAIIFELLANDGHSHSQQLIGLCHYHGWGESENYPVALDWFSKSADQGNPYGQWWVGWCYRWGEGAPRDFTKAAMWFSKSAEQGNRYGQCNLGYLYKDGNGVTECIDTAVIWYRESASQGNEEAIDRLKELGKWP